MRSKDRVDIISILQIGMLKPREVIKYNLYEYHKDILFISDTAVIIERARI